MTTEKEANDLNALIRFIEEFRGKLKTAWNAPNLTREQRRQIQLRLAAAGFHPEGTGERAVVVDTPLVAELLGDPKAPLWTDINNSTNWLNRQRQGGEFE